MSFEVKMLMKKDIESWSNIIKHAYPSFPGERLKDYLDEKMEKREEGYFYGVFEGEKLLGGMRIYDILLTARKKEIPADGLGFVAVDFLNKKKHVAKELVSFYLNRAKESGRNMAMLYPFRVDFYKNMGFGYGAKLYQFRVDPSAFPKGPSKEDLCYLAEEESDLLVECHNRAARGVNGMTKVLNCAEKTLFKKGRVIAYRKEGKVEGYIAYKFQPVKEGYGYHNDLVVISMIYENREAFSELCTFLNSQKDQINRIIMDTHDPSIQFVLSDPTNGSYDYFNAYQLETCVEAVGVMFRIVNVKGILDDFSDEMFGDVDMDLKLTIEDSFMTENTGSYHLSCRGGKIRILENEKFDAEISMGIAEFSSLFMGAVDFSTLYKLNLAEISHPEAVEKVTKLFKTEKPVCETHF